MDIAGLIGAIAGAVAILAAVITVTKYFVQAPLQARIAELTTEAERTREDTARERERVAEVNDRYQSLLRDFSNLKQGKSGVLIKNEIDAELSRGMRILQATESSILVPGPGASSSFVFLSIYGPAAPKLRYSKLPLDKGKAGKVFATGRLDNAADPAKDSEFFEEMDRKGAHTTRTLLTLPLRHAGRIVGVVQFLNKQDNMTFTREDEMAASDLANGLAERVADFVREPSNFELLGLSTEQEGKEETVVFCDLTASSSLFSVLDVASAIDCVNEYFERQSEVAMRFGATVDKYLGDGIMLRFAPRDIRDDEHFVRAIEASIAMIEDFDGLKRSWLDFEMRVDALHTRVGAATGQVYEVIQGHRQHQQITVVGESVNAAANLCSAATRDRNVILVDKTTRERIGDRFLVEQVPDDDALHAKGLSGAAYEVLGVPTGRLRSTVASTERADPS
jgi:class 3 adenylate cyclase